MLKNKTKFSSAAMLKIGDPIIELPKVGSTNIYAMEQAHARLAKPGTVYFAREQTEGKGQRQKTWKSEPGKNLILSAVTCPEADFRKYSFLLSCATALACVDFFNKFTGDETTIKWPNDIYWRDRKAGGILIENIIRGHQWEYAIIGIGMNINQTVFDLSLPNPVSLKQITGRNFNISEMTFLLCSSLSQRYNQFERTEYDLLLTDYKNKMFRKDKAVSFKKDNGIIEGIVRSVNPDGKLVLENERKYLELGFGEVEWVF